MTLGTSFGKNLHDEMVKAASRFYVGYDNVSLFSKGVNDFICRLVTGDKYERRALYSNGEVFTLAYKRTGVITSRTLPDLEEDGMERIIPIYVDRFQEFKDEGQIATQFKALHPRVLGGLFDAVSMMLKGLSDAGSGACTSIRNAAFYRALTAYDADCASAYMKNVEEVMRHMADDDPFVQVVKQWLGEQGGRYRAEPKEAFRSISAARPTDDDWWPKGERAMSQALSNKTVPLDALGISFEIKRAGGRRYWVFASRPKPKVMKVGKPKRGSTHEAKGVPEVGRIKKTPELEARLRAVREAKEVPVKSVERPAAKKVGNPKKTAQPGVRGPGEASPKKKVGRPAAKKSIKGNRPRMKTAKSHVPPIQHKPSYGELSRMGVVDRRERKHSPLSRLSGRAGATRRAELGVLAGLDLR